MVNGNEVVDVCGIDLCDWLRVWCDFLLVKRKFLDIIYLSLCGLVVWGIYFKLCLVIF